eukprot:3580905-Pleurochrysis_carterae.AAC.1
MHPLSFGALVALNGLRRDWTEARRLLSAVKAPAVHDVADGQVLNRKGLRGPSVRKEVPLDPVVHGKVETRFQRDIA